MHIRRLIIIAIVLEALMGAYFVSQSIFASSSFKPNMPPLPSPSSTPTPISEDKKMTMHSLEGDKTLIAERAQVGNSYNYSFSVRDNKDKTEKYLFSKILPIPQEITIPLNSWSPDQEYTFVRMDELSDSDYYVFRSDGTEEPEFQGIKGKFQEKFPEYKFVEVTGWAAPDLLIINALDEKEDLHSFWFEVPSEAIIPLGSKFY